MATATKKASVPSSSSGSVSEDAARRFAPGCPLASGRRRLSVPGLAQAGGRQHKLAGGITRSGTFFERGYGTAAAQDFVYQSTWFAVLLAFLATNILCAALIRFPWKKRQTGFVITHLGLLVLIFGSYFSFKTADEGLIVFLEGQSRATLVRQAGARDSRPGTRPSYPGSRARPTTWRSTPDSFPGMRARLIFMACSIWS